MNRLDAPAGVRAFAGNGRIDLEWDAPASGSGVSGYRVQWKAPSGDYDTTKSADVGADAGEYAVTSLTDGEPYVARVQALNSAGVAGEGTESEQVTVGRPRAVRNLTVAGRKNDFRLDWEAPVERGEGFLKDGDGNPVLVYRVTWEREGQSQDLALHQAKCRDGRQTTSVYGWFEITSIFQYNVTIPGDGDNYSFTVEAKFQAGPDVVTGLCRLQTGFGEQAQASGTEGRATASDADHDALRTALESLVDARDERWPWLRTVWDHISGEGVVAADLDRDGNGHVDSACTWTSLGGVLSDCRFSQLSIDLDWDLLTEETFDYVAVHELAHVWTTSSALHDQETRTPVGHAALYFLGQQYNGDSEAMEACAFETLADAVSHVAEGVAPAHLVYYGDLCFSDARGEPTALSEGVVLHALHPSGTAPGGGSGAAESTWFADTYSGDGATAWAAVKGIQIDFNRALVLNLLQDKFGGYCSIRAANQAAFGGDSDITDPWRNGGCEPEAPAVTATAGAAAGSIAVSWTAASSGGAPPLGYRVQWKPASDEWPAPGSVIQEDDLEEPAAVSHTITGLVAGAEYTVRVSAYNSIGEGHFSTDAPVTSSAASANASAKAEPLTASFEDLRGGHNGADAFTFRIAFSEPISISYTVLRDSALDVTGGSVAEARRVEGRSDLWEITVEPSSNAAVTVMLPATEDCDAQGAVCTEDGRGLSYSVAALVEGPAVEEDDPVENSPATGQLTISGAAQVGETLTASTSGIADEDGLDNATFSYQWVRNDGTADSDIQDATGATYTLTGDDAGKPVKVRVSFTDDAGNAETLTSAATEAVAGLPPEPLTAVIENAATSHDGENVFTFEVRFSEEFELSYKTLRDHAFTVTGGAVKKAERMKQGSNVGWRITVRPDSDADVTIVLPVTADCDHQRAICTEDGRMLSNRLELTVAGPGG